MANVQIRNVPDDLHHELKERAAANGQSLNAYLLRELRAMSRRPTTADWLEHIRRQPPYTGPPVAPLIREDRDSH